MRIVQHDRKDLVPRIANRWTVSALFQGMARGLREAQLEVPDWLATVAAEPEQVETAVFGMT